MFFGAGTEFDAVIEGEPCHLIVRQATFSKWREPIAIDEDDFSLGPTSMEIELTMVVIPLRRHIEEHKELTRPPLGIEKGS